MATSFFYIYVNYYYIDNFFDIYKLTERPVVLLNAIFSGAGQTKQGTRSPIELLWTAKNVTHCIVDPSAFESLFCRENLKKW